MHRTSQFILKRGMDAALAFHPGQSFKRSRHDADLEMGFTHTAIVARRPGMAGMAGAFIHHLQANGRKGGSQLVTNGVGNCHGGEVPLRREKVKHYVFLSFTLSIP